MRLYKIYCNNFFFIIFLILVQCPHVANAIYFKNIGIKIKEGLPQISVISIHQDILGRMWFGTLEGLSIYDGRKMQTIKGGNEIFDRYIKGNNISCIKENYAHDIFFMADSALIEYKFSQDKFNRIRENGITFVSSIDGHIYVGVKDSILCWDEEKRQLLHFLTTKDIPSDISSIFKDSSGQLWVTSMTGLYKREDEKWKKIIKGTFVRSITESHDHNLWISTNKGLYMLNKKEELIRFIHDPSNTNSLCNNQVRRVVEDREGNIWIGTFKGLNKYSPQKHQFEFYGENYKSGGLKHASIHEMYINRQGDLWLGTYYGGVSFFNPQNQAYSFYPVGHDNNSLGFQLVGQMVEDNDHNIWICTDGGGLNCLNRETGNIHSYNMLNSPIRSNNLKSICYNSATNKIYVALFQNGIFSYDIKYKVFEDLTKKMKAGNNPNTIRVGIWNKKLIYLLGNGVYGMDLETYETFSIFPQYGCQDMYIGKDYLWILHGTEVVKVNISNNEIIKRTDLKAKSVEPITPLCINEHHNGRVYIGTMGKGIIDLGNDLNSFKIYTSENTKLLDNYCYAISSISKTEILFLTGKGLSFFNTEDYKIKFTVYLYNLPVSGFNDGNKILHTHDGNLFIGSTDGLLQLNKESIYTKVPKLSLYFSELFVNNTRVTPGDKTGIMNRIISEMKTIHLKYNQNNFGLTFANNDFGSYFSSPLYEYKLEGFDSDWIPVRDDMEQLYYTNIPPGNYILHLREKNHYENNIIKNIELAIVIHQPIWNTVWAWLIYFLLIALLSYYIISARLRQSALQKKLANEKEEKKRIEEMDNFKFNFFTDISHELRTPLMLIITQTELLMRSKAIAIAFRGNVNRLYQNACYMSNLINELLDFHKLEQKQIHLKIANHNLVPFLTEIFNLFKEKANIQEIRYKFNSELEETYCWFDDFQLRKVFFNLLSNAFKHTPKGGLIEMILSEEDNFFTIKVIDSGTGINEKDIEKIFDRLYQASSDPKVVGSGIGLAVSKGIIDLHHGRIKAESALGYGSIFTVYLQKDINILKNDPQIEIINSINVFHKNSNIISSNESGNIINQVLNDTDKSINIQNNQRINMLIVEDDIDLRYSLKELFSNSFNISEAANGLEGWIKVQEELPDIVLSDVMMPEMNGLEMCRKIKCQEKTKHIPIILLTAAGSTEEQIEGLKAGADEYITKPFDIKILILKINTILKNRNIFDKKQDKNDKKITDESPNDFLYQAKQVVEKNIGDSEFSVDKLAEELGLSRSSLFKRMKSEKGVSPAEFILELRLKKGADLLIESSDYQIEEIAMQIGFGSGRYFSKVFKEYFKMSPSQYRKIYKAKN